MTFIVLLTFSVVIRNVFLYNAVVEQYSDLEVQLIYQQETFSERYILIVFLGRNDYYGSLFWQIYLLDIFLTGIFICSMDGVRYSLAFLAGGDVLQNAMLPVIDLSVIATEIASVQTIKVRNDIQR